MMFYCMNDPHMPTESKLSSVSGLGSPYARAVLSIRPASSGEYLAGSHQEPGWGPSLEVWGEDGQLREHTSPQNTIKRKENITSAVEVENKQYDSIFVAESSHDRLLSKEKTKSYHPPTAPPPPQSTLPLKE